MKKPKVHVHDPDDMEGCLCDIEIDAGELTGDGDLPAASGGVEAVAVAAGAEEDIDGCDVDFTKTVTPDAELPAASGGVA